MGHGSCDWVIRYRAEKKEEREIEQRRKEERKEEEVGKIIKKEQILERKALVPLELEELLET